VVVELQKGFKLTSRKMHPEDSVVSVGPIDIGGERIVVIAGPCAVESPEQTLAVARAVRNYGAVLFRGGAFKPRSSPYAFQGLEEEGLQILARVREEVGLPVVSEMTSPTQAELMERYVDVVQVGARNMQNFELLKRVGRMTKPVLLKRGMSATIEEWLMSAEYILSEGNKNVVLCERGIRTFEPYTRNTLDMSAIPVLKKLTHLPVLVDPSHATGIRQKVAPMARSAVAAGADGLMIEVHDNPDEALSDGPQSLYPGQFGQLMRDIYVIAPVVGKQVDFAYLDKATAVEPSAAAGRAGERTAAVLGEPGTYSHRACTQFFGTGVAAVSMPSFRAVFGEVAAGRVDYGVVPLENSLTGSIHQNYDLLLEHELEIVGDVTLRITHHLAAPEGTNTRSIRTVYSHPQVFQQCRQFLDCRESWECVPVSDTTAALERAKQNGDGVSAAIANRGAVKLHGMEILEEGIETNPRNFTRFVVIAGQPLDKAARTRSSLVYCAHNQPGALFATLQIFAENDINLVKLESRPIHGKPWEYMFYVDIEADVEAPVFAPVLEKLEASTDFLRVLGSY